MGYSTLPETLQGITATMSTMHRLQRHHGHVLNWYDSQTLAPLPPHFISTVDNGNLAGCLWALKQGLLEFTKRSAILSSVWRGLEDHIRLLEESAALEGRGGSGQPSHRGTSVLGGRLASSFPKAACRL